MKNIYHTQSKSLTWYIIQFHWHILFFINVYYDPRKYFGGSRKLFVTFSKPLIPFDRASLIEQTDTQVAGLISNATWTKITTTNSLTTAN